METEMRGQLWIQCELEAASFPAPRGTQNRSAEDPFSSTIPLPRRSSMNGPVPVEQLEHLDLSTFLEVSQALSGEIVLERLIDTLMRLGLEHSGARRGVLVLPFGAGWQVAAEAIAGFDGVTVRTPTQPPCPGSLPQSLFDHVVRTRERVVVDDASAADASPSDVYFGQKRVRSVLCLPLLKGAELIAVLYLENDLVPGAFTPARCALL